MNIYLHICMHTWLQVSSSSRNFSSFKTGTIFVVCIDRVEFSVPRKFQHHGLAKIHSSITLCSFFGNFYSATSRVEQCSQAARSLLCQIPTDNRSTSDDVIRGLPVNQQVGRTGIPVSTTPQARFDLGLGRQQL